MAGGADCRGRVSPTCNMSTPFIYRATVNMSLINELVFGKTKIVCPDLLVKYS